MARRPAISTRTIVTQNSLPAVTRVGGKRRPMSMELVHYYGFDRVGARLWQFIEEPRSVGAVCRRLSDEFDVDRDECERNVVSLLRLLVRDRLVQVIDEAA